MTWGEDGGRGLGAGQMLGVHDERMEQRGEKETQGRMPTAMTPAANQL